jgi:hypothetical protein
MGRALFVVSIAVGATLLTSFVAFVGMLWTDGEDREAIGLLWIFTLPGTLLVSLLGASRIAAT